MNNHSFVTRIDFGRASVLVTGDLETDAIRNLIHCDGPTDAGVSVDRVGARPSTPGDN